MKATDQRPTQPSPDLDETVRALLITIADRLDHNAPDDSMTNAARIARIGDLTVGEPGLFDQLMAAAPIPTSSITRSAYAAELRLIAGAR